VLTAKDDHSGAAVDWWFMYKVPGGIRFKKGGATKGDEYLYYDLPSQKLLGLSPHSLGAGPEGALFHTLQQLYADPSSSMGWIFYNDEYPYSMEEGEWPEKSDWPPKVKPKIYGPQTREKDRGHPVDHAHNGHCKGVLAFDIKTDTAFWLSHSTPRIPALHVPEKERFFYPEYADTYAQTFICITLKNVKAACDIAEVMVNQQDPQVFGCRLPEAVEKDSPYGSLWTLAQGSLPPNYGKSYAEKHAKKEPADITFQSKGGKEFRLLAKSGAWFDDFWIDLVEPKLGVDLRIETWRRLTPTATLPGEDSDGDGAVDYGPYDFTTTFKNRKYHHEFLAKDGKEVVDEITNIDLGELKDSNGAPLTGYAWAYTKDHAKWAISEETEDCEKLDDRQGTKKDWVCIADMNRMTSQEKRGGGAICFHEPDLWKGLNEIERVSGKIT